MGEHLVLGPRQGLLVALSGPSGVGKGTVVSQAMGQAGPGAARVRRSISVTTRPPRAGEVEGVDYFFCSTEEFARAVEEGRLLEWASYLDNRYGTPAARVDEELAAGHDVVLEIEVQGAMQVRERRPEAVLIYMLPPSWEELERRLAWRDTDDGETQRRRMAVAKEEVTYVPRYDYVIENDEVAAAAGRLLAILEAERWRVKRLGSELRVESGGGELRVES